MDDPFDPWFVPEPPDKWTAIKALYQRWLPLLILGLLVGWVGYVYTGKPSRPPVGAYMAALACVTVIVAIWPLELNWSKAAWLVVFFLLAWLEIKTQYQERAENQAQQVTVRAEQEKRFNDIALGLETNIINSQHQFEVTMGEVKGSTSYIYFFAYYKQDGEIPLLMVNPNKTPVRGVKLEIHTLPVDGKWASDQQEVDSLRNPKLVTIGDVNPGFGTAPFTLPSGRYYINIVTRTSAFSEKVTMLRDPTLPIGWLSNYCVMGSGKILLGKCD